MRVENIKVEYLLDDPNRKMRITWDAFPGANSYKVYASLAPYNNTNLIAQNIINEYYETIPPIVDGVYFYFWVTAMFGAPEIESDKNFLGLTNYPYEAFEDSESPLSEAGEEYYQNSTMKEYFEEILTRELATLENFGEKCYLYKRRWTGVPCIHEAASGGPGTLPGGGMFDPEPTGDNQDRDLQAVNRCLDCFGTGLYGGYYPKVEIFMRYRSMPVKRYKFESRGIVSEHDFDSWTIYHPILKDKDVIVRKASGERLLVVDPKVSEWRGLPLHQEFNVTKLGIRDIEFHIADAKIADALTHSTGKPKEDWLLWT